MRDDRQHVIKLGTWVRVGVSLFTFAGIVAMKEGALMDPAAADPVLWITFVYILLNIPYLFLYRRFGLGNVQAAAYVAVDVCFITVLTHFLGGIEAFYTIYAYIIVILFCHFYLTRFIAVGITAMAVLCHLALIGMELTGVLHHHPTVGGLYNLPPWAQGLLAGVHIFVMVLMSAFAGVIAAKMNRKTAEVIRANRIIAEQNRTLEKEVEKRTAELHHAQKMESVGRLAGGVAHDFNNMLSIILGHAELVQMKLDPENPLRENIREVLTAGRRSADLVQQLLAFARRQVIAPKVLDLNDTLVRMLTMLARLIGEEIGFRWKPARGLWPVLVDPAQLNQILVNLVVNARDAISGHGTITLETGNATIDAAHGEGRQGGYPGEYVFLAVGDTGCGMNGETLEHIYEPFFSTKPPGKGTGLGLSTVYGIVQQNRGFIRVQSQPGRGTTVSIHLPRAEGEVSHLADTQSHAQVVGGGETVLLVEDEPGVLELTVSMLEPLGYTVLAANTPTQAQGLAEQYAGKVDLLVTDLIMPEMSGLELWQRLEGRWTGLKRLFISGYPTEVLSRHGLMEKDIPFLKKPFSAKELAAKLREVLDRPCVS